MLLFVVDCEGVTPGGLYLSAFAVVPVMLKPEPAVVVESFFRAEAGKTASDWAYSWLHYGSNNDTNGVTKSLVFVDFSAWVERVCGSEPPKFVSDNPAYDWQPINYGLHTHVGHNVFGHSARRIGDFYAGLVGNFCETQEWKSLRVTPHTHDPLDDARGNAEALVRLLKGERP